MTGLTQQSLFLAHGSQRFFSGIIAEIVGGARQQDLDSLFKRYVLNFIIVVLRCYECSIQREN
jgi:hypothetical protein